MTNLQKKMIDYGFGIHQIISDGNIHRFRLKGEKSKTGWYVGFKDGDFEAGAFGCWKSNIKVTVCNIEESNFTHEQKRQYAQKMAKKSWQNEININNRHKNAKNEINKLWGQLSTKELDTHPYLVKKQIKAFNIRKNSDGDIVIPIYDNNRILWNLQTIKSNGFKLFHKGAKVQGCYHPIGFLSNILTQLILCEGYSTGMSIYQSTSIATAVCFGANNLESVAKSLRAKYPKTKIIIAGDDDQFNSINTGRNKSFIAAKQVNASTIFPVFEDLSTKPTDFNDLYCLEGLEAVRKQFMGVCDVF